MDGFALTEAIRAHPAGATSGPDPHLARQRGGPPAGPRRRRRRLHRQERLRRGGAAVGRRAPARPPATRERQAVTASVVVVEDSPVQRAHLVDVSRPRATSPSSARRRRGRGDRRWSQPLRPDVVTLDLEIPDGGGQRVIEQLMALRPTPILVLSARHRTPVSRGGRRHSWPGAVDVLPKPTRWDAAAERELRCAGAHRRRGRASSADPRGRTPAAPGAADPHGDRPTDRRHRRLDRRPGRPGRDPAGPRRLGAACSSSSTCTPTSSTAWWRGWHGCRPLPVELAPADGDRSEPGVVLHRPGRRPPRVGRRSTGSCSTATAGDPAPARRSTCCSTSSARRGRRGRSVGVLLTGMGDDGAAGLLALRRRGDVDHRPGRGDLGRVRHAAGRRSASARPSTCCRSTRSPAPSGPCRAGR